MCSLSGQSGKHQRHPWHGGFSGTEVPVNLSMVPAKIGDYVLVHAGMAIQIVEKKEAHDWIDLFKEIEELEKE